MEPRGEKCWYRTRRLLGLWSTVDDTRPPARPLGDVDDDEDVDLERCNLDVSRYLDEDRFEVLLALLRSANTQTNIALLLVAPNMINGAHGKGSNNNRSVFELF